MGEGEVEESVEKGRVGGRGMREWGEWEGGRKGGRERVQDRADESVGVKVWG